MKKKYIKGTQLSSLMRQTPTLGRYPEGSPSNSIEFFLVQLQLKPKSQRLNYKKEALRMTLRKSDKERKRENKWT